MGMTKALCYIIENFDLKPKLSVDFIKELHRLCMKEVKNTRQGTKPGEFRENYTTAAWDLVPGDSDTFEGLLENIIYLGAIQGKYPTDMDLQFSKDPNFSWLSSPANNKSEIRIWVQNELGKPVYTRYFSFKDNPQAIAKEIWAAVKEGKHVKYVTSKKGENLLTRVQDDCIQTLEDSLDNAQSKNQKLTAIFTFLKQVVLFHPFYDGVGRTYSMLLLQYLLIRENLMPVILKDSNMIPGFSVLQLVDEYLRAEKEMQTILEDSSFIKNPQFASPNVDTATILKAQSHDYHKMFQECLNLLKSTLDKLNLDINTKHAQEESASKKTT
ncbi:TPA: Fic family protein [Legionella pneumophila]